MNNPTCSPSQRGDATDTVVHDISVFEAECTGHCGTTLVMDNPIHRERATPCRAFFNVLDVLRRLESTARPEQWHESIILYALCIDLTDIVY